MQFSNDQDLLLVFWHNSQGWLLVCNSKAAQCMWLLSLLTGIHQPSIVPWSMNDSVYRSITHHVSCFPGFFPGESLPKLRSHWNRRYLCCIYLKGYKPSLSNHLSCFCHMQYTMMCFTTVFLSICFQINTAVSANRSYQIQQQVYLHNLYVSHSYVLADSEEKPACLFVLFLGFQVLFLNCHLY